MSKPLNLINVHDPVTCEGQGCAIHHPSDHHMVSWPQHWRPDRHMIERICPHGVGHPDPDDVAIDKIHGCDGCCVKEEDQELAHKRLKEEHDILLGTLRRLASMEALATPELPSTEFQARIAFARRTLTRLGIDWQRQAI